MQNGLLLSTYVERTEASMFTRKYISKVKVHCCWQRKTLLLNKKGFVSCHQMIDSQCCCCFNVSLTANAMINTTRQVSTHQLAADILYVRRGHIN